jgi:hypothetical protein
MAGSIDRMGRTRLLRGFIDAALLDAPEDICADPRRLMESPGPHPFSTRFVRAVREAGFEITFRSIGTKRVGGITQRMDLEDLVDMSLLAAGAAAVQAMSENDQARDRMAERLADTFRSRLILKRRS